MPDDVILTRREQLELLPERTAVRSRHGLLGEKGPDGNWYCPPGGEPLSFGALLAGGVRVLDLGGAWPGADGYPSGGNPGPSFEEMRAMLDEAAALGGDDA